MPIDINGIQTHNRITTALVMISYKILVYRERAWSKSSRINLFKWCVKRKLSGIMILGYKRIMKWKIIQIKWTNLEWNYKLIIS